MTTLFVRRMCLTYRKSLCIRAALYSSQAEHASESGKVVNVAIIGSPNSGKSTLINNITERKICAASNKVHTTTKLMRAMCYQDDTQIIFLDTPGVITSREQKKYNLPESMIGACHKSLRCADVIGVVHDVSNSYTKESMLTDVVNMLKMVQEIPSFLILNKIDTLKSKSQLLTIIRTLTNGLIAGNPIPGKDKEGNKKKLLRGYSHFSDVFLVSALKGDGIQDIKQYLMSNAKPANFQYSSSKWTDQSPEILIEEAVRAKFLDFLSQEIPYNLTTLLEYYEEIKEENKIICSVVVECPSERLLRLVAGAGGGRLQQIKSHVTNDLFELFKKTVVIDIQLKVKMQKSKP